MKDRLWDDEDELRTRLRSLIAEEVPPGFRGALGNDPETNAISDRFCRRLGGEGLLTINWPQEFGGGGGDMWSQAIVREEMWAAHEPRGPQYMGLNWVGPAIMRFGTAEQKDRLLPLIAAGEAHWCQGFSEPGAGSDLAALSLPAIREPDGTWKISGQKLWTSYAEVAEWCFLTTRTDSSVRKHAGITVFLIPMSRSGITVRPIDSIMGRGHLHEIFFDGLIANDDDMLGHAGQGWEIIRAVLDFERIGIARYARSDRMLHDLWEYAAERSEDMDEDLQLQHARALVHTRTARLLSYRTVALLEAKLVSSGDPSVARLASTTLDQELGELAMEMLGSAAVSNEPDAPLGGFVEDAWRYARSAGIASGTTEIQRLLIARDVLSNHSAPLGRDWPWEAVAFGDTVRDLLVRLGAVDLARQAEADPGRRLKALGASLEKLGWSELDPHEDPADAIIAALACRAAGAVVAPWPVAVQLTLPRDLREEFGGLYLTADDVVRLEHLDVLAPAVVLDLRSERVARATPVASIRHMPLDPFGVPCELGDDVTERASPAVWRRAADLNVILVAFYVLGALEYAVAMATDYAGQREQFGQLISSFGAVQWRLADITVARYGLAELAQDTLRRFCQSTVTPADALALRLATVEAAQCILANAHQVFGAVGLTEDHDLAVIDRHLQPMLRRPAGRAGASILLRDAIRSHGFDGLFPIRALDRREP